MCVHVRASKLLLSQFQTIKPLFAAVTTDPLHFSPFSYIESLCQNLCTLQCMRCTLALSIRHYPLLSNSNWISTHCLMKKRERSSRSLYLFNVVQLCTHLVFISDDAQEMKITKKKNRKREHTHNPLPRASVVSTLHAGARLAASEKQVNEKFLRWRLKWTRGKSIQQQGNLIRHRWMNGYNSSACLTGRQANICYLLICDGE